MRFFTLGSGRGGLDSGVFIGAADGWEEEIVFGGEEICCF